MDGGLHSIPMGINFHLQEGKEVGYYGLDPNNLLRFYYLKKPSCIHRWFCQWCLGWTWHDMEMK